MKEKKTAPVIALVFLMLIIFSLAVSGQIPRGPSGYRVSDPNFVPWSSQECGNQANDCVIAVFTGVLLSMNRPHVGTNGIAIASRMMNLTKHRPANDTTLDKAINATATILSRGLV